MKNRLVHRSVYRYPKYQVAIVDGIPAIHCAIRDSPVDGHQTGRDALALPMEPIYPRGAQVVQEIRRQDR